MTAPLGDDLRSALERGEFGAKANEIYVARTPASGWRAARIVFVGGGPRSEINVERIRRMAASAAQVARQQRRARIGWADVEPGVIATAARIETVAEGFVLANFDNGVHKSRDDESVLHPRRRDPHVRQRRRRGRQPARRWASRSTPRAC